MKIVMIGPVYPYKGGISHYTGIMCRSLRRKHDVSLISFELQYPKSLYKKEQRDYKNHLFEINDAQFLINTINPFSWFATAKKIKSLNPDLVIIQWWHPYFTLCYCGIIQNLKNIKVLFLCHNIFPHERLPLDKWLTRRALKRGDIFIVHSEKDAEDIQSILPNAKYKRTVHPTYNIFKFKNINCIEAREILNLGQDKKVLLFFGFVREYKGLKYLIDGLRVLREKYDDIILLIAGDFNGRKEDYIKMIEDHGLRDYTSVHDGYIPDCDVEIYFAAADLVVLPYVSATQSGIVQIAYSFSKPVIATNVAGLPEAVLDEKTGYIVEARDSEAIAEAVQKFFEGNKAEDFARNIKNEEYKYSWDRMTELVENLWKG